MITVERPLAYMVALDLAGRRCVVVGSGEIAARRVQALLDTGAQVTVVAQRLGAELTSLADRGDIAWVRREYRRGDLAGAAVAFNTSTDRDLEQRVCGDARRAGVLLNTHDRPAACDFASPALVRRGRLQIAVSTSGDSPHFAAAMRDRLESLIGPEWGAQLSLIATVRRRLRRARVPLGRQQITYRELMRGRVREALRLQPAAADLMEATATEPHQLPASKGVVHLVGAGPGDPGLLTVAARDLLLEADIVFHDALVSPSVLQLCGPRTKLVDVGKRGGGAHTAQDQIMSMLIEAARSGQAVVRLKGGDPFVFGRGGEELAVLRAAGMTVHVVPGVSSALAAPAAAGIAVTFRGVSGSVAIVSGQDADGDVPPDLARVAAVVDTLVVLMPLRTLDGVTARLQEALTASTPAAVIAGATTDEQRIVRAPLGEIERATREAGITAPATLVVGRVVDLLHHHRQAKAEGREFEPLTTLMRTHDWPPQRAPSSILGRDEVPEAVP
ncbi:MAG TPA: uroporphyrinogen-III C-methyltransferase [Candidatus Dormibacteraeota bacterium]